MAMVRNIARFALLAGVALPICAHAQDAGAANAPAAPVATAGDNTIQEILVTARRRSERALDVPTTITALDSRAIAKYGSSDLSSLGNQVPQVMFTKNPSGNGGNIAIRGVGTNTSADDGVEQAVSVTIDDYSTARGRVLQSGLFDIGSVQVLKGPQALYFGKNSPGGAIIIDSKGPTDKFEGYVSAGYEFTAHEFYGEGAVGGPLTPTLGIRVAVRGSDMLQGYVQNVGQPISAANDPIAWDKAFGYNIPGKAFSWGPQSKTAAGRVTLDWKPSSDFEATFKFMYTHYHDNGDASQNVLVSCSFGGNSPIVGDLSRALFTGAPGAAVDPVTKCGPSRTNTIAQLPAQLQAGLNFNGNNTEFTNNNNYLGTFKMTYHGENATLTSVTGYYNYSNVGTSFFDNDNLSVAGGGANSYYEGISEELRAELKISNALSLTSGALFGHDARTYRTMSDIIRYLDPVTGISSTSTGQQYTSGMSVSAFAAVNYKITSTIELSGGARFTNEKKNGTLYDDYVSRPGAAFGVALPVGQVLTPHLNNNNVSPQATLSWHPTRDINVYADYRTGFKAGAISNPGLIAASLTSTNTVLRPEKINGFEGGVKFESPDRRFSGDVAAYTYKYTDLQLSAFNSLTNSVMTTNAGFARVEGIEGALRYRAMPELELHASGGYNNSHFTSFTNAGCFGGQTAAQGCVNNQQNLSGSALPRSPKWSETAGATYARNIAGNLALSLNVDGRFSSAYNFTATNNPYSVQSNYAALDASIRLASLDKGWDLALIGKNLTNKFYIVVGSETPLGVSPGAVNGVPGNPRTVQLQATYHF